MSVPALLRSNAPAAALVSYQTKYAYDSLDRIVRLVYPDNDQLDYRYNARNQMSSMSGDVAGQVIAFPEYSPSGQRVQSGNRVWCSRPRAMHR